MDQRHDGRTFSDGAAYALHGTRTHVADGEHARYVRLQRRRRAARRKSSAGATGEHEALRVAPHLATVEPTGLGVGTDEQEHVAYRPSLVGARAAVAPRYRFQSS